MLASLLIAAAPPADGTLSDACGATPSWFCEAAWNVTERSTLTRAIDWIVARPLAALLVLVVAAILVRWLQRLSGRFVDAPEVLGVDRVGVDGTAIRVAIATLPGEHARVMRAMRLAIKRRLDEDGIGQHPGGPDVPGIA